MEYNESEDLEEHVEHLSTYLHLIIFHCSSILQKSIFFPFGCLMTYEAKILFRKKKLGIELLFK